MADTLTRRSPLQWLRNSVRESAAGGDRGRRAVRRDGRSVGRSGRAGWRGGRGSPRRRRAADHAVHHGVRRRVTAIWLGPEEWLVTSERRDGEGLESTLRDAMSEHGGAAVDVSAQRTTLRLRGTRARDVIAKGCSLDSHPAVFGPGAAAQTVLGQAGVVLIPLSDNGTDYRLIVRSSFARYLADWLIDAAEEFGVDW